MHVDANRIVTQSKAQSSNLQIWTTEAEFSPYPYVLYCSLRYVAICHLPLRKKPINLFLTNFNSIQWWGILQFALQTWNFRFVRWLEKGHRWRKVKEYYKIKLVVGKQCLNNMPIFVYFFGFAVVAITKVYSIFSHDFYIL